MKTVEDYVLKRFPKLDKERDAKLVGILVGLQRFNPDLPKHIQRPKLEVLDWEDKLARDERLRDIKTAIKINGQLVNDEERS